ncbi:MAG TPA: hypothetical protein VKS98_08980 [Chthoniobacterales bacterium]|nr:hypothetical protein [Chthoniobacterales bacterium]
MNTRILFAGILGGVVLFIWNFVAHDLLPLGRMGVRFMTNEDAVSSAIQTNLGDNSGVYFFPTGGLTPDATRQQQQEAMKKAEEQMASGASGFLIYRPKRVFNMPKRLIIQFGTDVACALLAVFLLSQTSIAGFGGKVGFVFTAGILAAITTNIPYANWYGFPKDYTFAQIIIQVVGFLLVGIVAAMMVGRRTASSA